MYLRVYSRRFIFVVLQKFFSVSVCSFVCFFVVGCCCCHWRFHYYNTTRLTCLYHPAYLTGFPVYLAVRCSPAFLPILLTTFAASAALFVLSLCLWALSIYFLTPLNRLLVRFTDTRLSNNVNLPTILEINIYKHALTHTNTYRYSYICVCVHCKCVEKKLKQKFYLLILSLYLLNFVLEW